MPRGIDRYDEARLQARLWAPECDRDTLLANWDASDRTSLTVGSGGAVSSWASRVRGISASQATGSKQPVYSASARNGRPGLTFAASSAQALDISSVSGWTGAITFMAVGYTTTAGYRLCIGWDTSFAGGAARDLGVTSGRLAYSGCGGSDVNTAATWNGNDLIAMGVYPASGTTTQISGADGVETSGTVTAISPSGGAQIGARGSTAYWDGVIQQVVVFNGQLPAWKRNRLVGFAAWKWGLQKNLPASHPYKNRPPLIGD